jgi:proline dehydrogenase
MEGFTGDQPVGPQTFELMLSSERNCVRVGKHKRGFLEGVEKTMENKIKICLFCSLKHARGCT